MAWNYLDFDLSVLREDGRFTTRVLSSPAGEASAPFVLPFGPAELAQFMVVVGPPRASTRRLVPASSRVLDVKDYGTRLGQALLSGEVDDAFRRSLSAAAEQGKNLRIRLHVDAELDPVPWEYLYDERLDRFLSLSQETPVVRLLEALERPPVLEIEPPLRVLVMISSPSDVPELAVQQEEQLLRATTGDLVKSGQLELVVLEDATLSSLQRALIEEFHVFHFIGHGGFDSHEQEGVLVLEREDGTAHRVSASRLGTLLHDARSMQLAVLNACEGARSSGRDAFSGVAQELVRRGLPAVVAMQAEISDRAALVFTHEFYWFLTRGLPIDAAMCEVRKAMATSDEASEWGTAVLLRSDVDQSFRIRPAGGPAPQREQRWESLYEGAQGALAAGESAAAVTMLEQIESERPDYQDVTELLQRVRPEAAGGSPPPVDVQPVDVQPAGGEHVRPAGGEHVRPSDDWPTVVPVDDRPSSVGEATPSGGDAPLTSPGDDDGATSSGDDATVVPPHPPGRRVGLLVGGGVAVLALAGALVWNTLRDPPVIDETPTATATATAGRDALTEACGPAPDVPIEAGDLQAGCATTQPVIDGDFSEWADVPAVVVRDVVASVGQPEGEFSARWATRWDTEALYIHAAVTDPMLTPVDVAQPGQFWRGDSVSFEFGPDARDLAATDPVRDGRDRHVMIGITGDGAGAAVNVAGGGTFPAGALEPDIAAVAVRTDAGYEVEARVPWTALGEDPPARGDVFAANLNVSDAAAPTVFGRMISSNPDRTGANQARPGTWQTLVLGDG